MGPDRGVQTGCTVVVQQSEIDGFYSWLVGTFIGCMHKINPSILSKLKFLLKKMLIEINSISNQG